MKLQDYKDITKKLNAVTYDLKYGNPLNHKHKLQNINKAETIINSIVRIASIFGETKEMRDFRIASDNLLELYKQSTIDRFNKIHLQ